ncbi:phage tail tube protein [Flavobacterium sp. NRK1]|uniref:phage tail tube protein n=1 Tax=Flavobacterium sp. NRK1 TaxID=2954929 RepID=UPI00209348F0|nr:phage tail tube protein [Flavobacterium sp. NRK1]MCO6149057.1 phage tail tube protein [Flavobacterium sp. NRK1]
MAAGVIYKGKDVRIGLGGKTLWHATECSVSITNTLEAVSTKDTNGKIQVPSVYEWSASLSALVADKAADNTTQHSFTDLVAFQLANTELDLSFTTGVNGDFLYTGKVYINQSDITAATENSASGSFSFTGNGDLAFMAVDAVAPEPIVSISVSDITADEFLLTYVLESPNDNVGVTELEIYKDDVLYHTVAVSEDSTGGTVLISGLAAGTTADWKCRVKDAQDNYSAFTAAVSVTQL